MSELDPSAWLASIAEVFDSVDAEWTLVGALAANRYRATPRFTTDVDTLVAFDPELERRLIDAGYEVDVIADAGERPQRDRDDIRSILEAGGALDRTYLDRWIAEWDVADRWATFPA